MQYFDRKEQYFIKEGNSQKNGHFSPESHKILQEKGPKHGMYSNRGTREVYKIGRHTLKQQWYTQCSLQSQMYTGESVHYTNRNTPVAVHTRAT